MMYFYILMFVAIQLTTPIPVLTTEHALTTWQIFIASIPQLIISIATLIGTIITAVKTNANRKTLVERTEVIESKANIAATKADVAARRADDIHTTVQSVKEQAKEIKEQTDGQLSVMLAKYEESQAMIAKMMAILAAREGSASGIRVTDAPAGKVVPPLGPENQERRKQDR